MRHLASVLSATPKYSAALGERKRRGTEVFTVTVHRSLSQTMHFDLTTGAAMLAKTRRHAPRSSDPPQLEKIALWAATLAMRALAHERFRSPHENSSGRSHGLRAHLQSRQLRYRERKSAAREPSWPL